MDPTPPRDTSVTLLGRLHQDPTDARAWSDFVHRYGPRIYRWCRGWNLADADAQDVTQNVLLKLYAQLPKFAYDPQRSFRAWLKTLTHHAWRDYLASQGRAGRGSGDSNVREALDSLAAREELARQLEEEFDLELLAEASLRVQARVASHTWEAYRLLTQEALATTEVAERLQMQPAMVLVAKSKVIRMLREEVQQLEGVSESG